MGKARARAPRSALTIAIDGPAGAGKSTVSREVARRLGYALVDTGAIYRCLALVAQRRGTALGDDPALAELIAGMQVSFAFDGRNNHTYLGTEDVTDLIRTPSISSGAAQVSTRPAVRSALLGLQRRLAGGGGAVLEGRDVGTVVFPAAQVKIFLVATADERARRRHRERRAAGSSQSLSEVLAEQDARDHLDRTRTHAPLLRAPDAVEIDSTGRALADVVASILALVAAQGGQALDRAPPDCPQP